MKKTRQMMSVMGLCQWSGAEWMMNPDMATQIQVSTILGPNVMKVFLLDNHFWEVKVELHL